MKKQCRLLMVVLVALLCSVGVEGAGLDAQPSEGAAPAKIYTKRTAFHLPFRIEEKDRADLQEVKLFVKEGPSAPWVCQETAPPTKEDFTYRVARDGEYWFNVVTVDKAGHMAPADLNRDPPGLIVVVDSQSPDIDIRPFVLTTGERCLQCKVRDANPDYSRVRVEYQMPNTKDWLVLEPIVDQKGLYRVSDPSLKGQVRVTATDKAGNTSEREVNLRETTQTVNPSGQYDPIERTARKEVVPDLGAPGNPNGPKLSLINSRHASLDYQVDEVGNSGIGKVEVWITRDEGNTWQMLTDNQTKHSPAEIDLPGDGLFGISLVVTNGNGVGGTQPAKGDVPDWWVEVDTTKPVAQLVAVRPTSSEGSSAFLITWTASDKNLKSEPIDLYYATEAQGTWYPIARGLKNTGNYRWPASPGNGEFYFRMDVSDKAGNVTRCELTHPVAMDMRPPKIHVVNISSGLTQAAGLMPNAH